jgi:hypothetical protein
LTPELLIGKREKPNEVLVDEAKTFVVLFEECLIPGSGGRGEECHWWRLKAQNVVVLFKESILLLKVLKIHKNNIAVKLKSNIYFITIAGILSSFLVCLFRIVRYC